MASLNYKGAWDFVVHKCAGTFAICLVNNELASWLEPRPQSKQTNDYVLSLCCSLDVMCLPGAHVLEAWSQCGDMRCWNLYRWNLALDRI